MAKSIIVKCMKGYSMTDKKFDIYKIGFVIIAVISFVVMRLIGMASGINGYLNVDDLCSVQFAMIGDGFFDKINGILAEDPTNVPVFYLILYVWIKLFGYAANTMRILPEICGALFVFFAGLIGEKIGNKKMGIIAAIVAGTSLQLVYVSYQIRAYSMLMMFSAIAFYAFLRRTSQWKSIILYTVSLLLLSYTHFFGVLVCAGLGSIDILNILLKKREKKYLLCYVIYACLFVPYLVLAFIRANDMWAVFWPPVPTYRDIFSMIRNMCPGVGVSWGAYIFAFVFFVYLIFVVESLKKKECQFVQSEIFTCFWVIYAVIAVGFLYSKYIKPQSSVWVYRYFLVLFPFVVSVVSYGIWKGLDYIQERAGWGRTIFIGFVLFLGCVYTYTNIGYEIDHPNEIVGGSKNYEKLTEYIMETQDVKEQGTLVYMGYPDRYFEGWKQYASQGGKIALPNLYNPKDISEETDLSGYDTIYVVNIVYELTEEEKLQIEKTHRLVEQNCDGEGFVDKYVRY